jgi:hypothetical protein
MDHGATYDFCRVTLVFDIRKGDRRYGHRRAQGGSDRGLAEGDARADRGERRRVRHSVRIGDVIDFEIEDIVPFGVETGKPVKFDGMFHPVASDLTTAEAKRSRINAFGIEFEGKTGLSTSEFSWAA